MKEREVQEQEQVAKAHPLPFCPCAWTFSCNLIDHHVR
jgi:hypothetical protein